MFIKVELECIHCVERIKEVFSVLHDGLVMLEMLEFFISMGFFFYQNGLLLQGWKSRVNVL